MFKSFSFYFAILGVVFAVVLSTLINIPEPPLHSVRPTSSSPFEHFIEASGIIQSFDKDLVVGSPEDGLVEDVFVKVGETVKKGEPLFKLDTRALEGKLIVQKATQEVEKAEFEKQNERYQLFASIEDPKAISLDELKNLENLMKIAQARLLQAQVQVQETQQMIHRLTVHAPIDGTILQMDLRPGEYLIRSDKVIVMGNLTNFQILVSIDEQNAANFNQENPAVAYPKNNTTLQIPLKFYRVEPYIIPKKSLTGLTSEMVDTRVLQVIYTFDSRQNYPVYVGQQMDVFIKTP